jgi:N-acylneuraminate cytidylyltransferase
MVDRCYLDTESEEIIQECQDLTADGLRLLRRPPELATNEATGNDLMMWELGAIEPCDVLCQTFATAPMLRPETIDNCLWRLSQAYRVSDGRWEAYDSCLTVVKEEGYFWDADYEPINFDLDTLPNSDCLPCWLKETHGLYGILTATLRQLKRRVGRNPLLFPIPKREALDINDAEDLWMAERMLDD